ncbi:hypothetical protein FEM48_Zijuj10G0071100 [Ziziphus jujuba var. spinosa]|uniref:Helitron helicase-like domain-containing protein n=1 Tax=Ziziphus jujuba var. spinosa TaxID=714518 RepID=A0A978UM06_ZIZJJ|nr:hypothetical protein FEM48_Zijuj10G0071100 [Ziziphus jujuba var. spinosa]
MRGKMELPMMQDPPKVLNQNFDIKKLHTKIVHDLKMMLDEHNVLVKSFRIVKDTIRQHDSSNLKLRLIGRREGNGRMYNLPTVSEVTTLAVDNFETSSADRDIIVETQTGKLKQIYELNASYLGLQYPLHFLYGQDGYREDIPLKQLDTKSSTRRRRLNMREFFAYKLGGARYMIQNYQDAMAICKWAGYPKLFITLTCNPKMAKVVRFIENRGEDIDKIISTEIPDEAIDPEYYATVAWRILGFDIHYRDPPVERLNFHLPNEQNIIFLDIDLIDAIMNRNAVSNSMFSTWMDANKKYVEAKELTYAKFPIRFVWKSSEREWHPRKQGCAIEQMFFMLLGCGDMYYLRILFNIVQGPRNFEEIMNINGIQYNSLRDACYALGLLDDDKEYVDGVAEASN